MTTQRLSGKTALVTAAGQGIGRATALAFAREGARVVATDVNDDALAALAREAALATARLDVTDAATIEAFARAHGPVDVLFNCAGYVHAGTVLDSTDAQWTFALELNLLSMVRLIRARPAASRARRTGLSTARRRRR
jgi:2-keto-3-deoxy-L-fuconate dehydrogenase